MNLLDIFSSSDDEGGNEQLRAARPRGAPTSDGGESPPCAEEQNVGEGVGGGAAIPSSSMALASSTQSGGEAPTGDVHGSGSGSSKRPRESDGDTDDDDPALEPSEFELNAMRSTFNDNVKELRCEVARLRRERKKYSDNGDDTKQDRAELDAQLQKMATALDDAERDRRLADTNPERALRRFHHRLCAALVQALVLQRPQALPIDVRLALLEAAALGSLEQLFEASGCQDGPCMLGTVWLAVGVLPVLALPLVGNDLLVARIDGGNPILKILGKLLAQVFLRRADVGIVVLVSGAYHIQVIEWTELLLEVSCRLAHDFGCHAGLQTLHVDPQLEQIIRILQDSIAHCMFALLTLGSELFASRPFSVCALCVLVKVVAIVVVVQAW